MARALKPILHSINVRKVSNKQFEIFGIGKGKLASGAGISAILYVAPTVSASGQTTFNRGEVAEGDGVLEDTAIKDRVIHVGPHGSLKPKHKQTTVQINLSFVNDLSTADRYMLLINSGNPHDNATVPMWIPINLDVPA